MSEMFSKNHIVSVRQMKRLLVLDLFAGTSLVLPMAAGRLSGGMGIGAIILGGLLAALFALFLLGMTRKFSDSYPRFCVDTLGRFWGRLCMGIYAAKYFVGAALLLAMFAQIVNHTFLTDMPRLALGLLLLLVCVYSVFKGLETRARLGEMLVYLVILPVILIIVLAIPQMQLQRLWPLQLLETSQMGIPTKGAGGLGGFLWAFMTAFSMFSVVEWLLFLRPNVRRMEKARVGALVSILWPVLLNVLILAVCIGVFGVKGMNNEHWPTVVLMQIVRFPGGFLSRQDGLMLAFWMIGMFMLVGGHLYYGFLCFKSMSKKLCKPWMIVFPAVLVMGVFLCIYLQDAARWLLTFMVFIYMPLSVGLPLLLRVVCAWRRGFFRRNKILKVIRFLPLVLIFSLVAGCGAMVEIEDRNYVMCMGIDLQEDEGETHLSVSLGFPDLKALTGDGDNIHYPTAVIRGENLRAVEKNYGRQANKHLDYGQLQMIIFGEAMIKNPKKMWEVLTYIKDHQEFTRTVLVCAANGEAADIVALDEAVNGSIGIYLRQLFENNVPGYELTVGDLIIGMSLKAETYEMAVIAAGDEVPEYVGTKNIRGYTETPKH